ncbi:MAG: hypothetical protein M0Z50_12685 [Planctomycetia bacterium]|nr:hypothetical protein [Planctomycetia bacterium]
MEWKVHKLSDSPKRLALIGAATFIVLTVALLAVAHFMPQKAPTSQPTPITAKAKP